MFGVVLSVSPAQLQSLLQSAIGHHRAGRLADAELLYRRLLVAAPRHFDVVHLAGLVAYQQGRITDAVQLLARAHKLDSRHVVCEMRYALALIAAKRMPEAEVHFRHAVAVKPDFHEGWDNLAYCLKTQNRLLEAIGCHEKVVSIAPSYAVGWYNYGLTLSLSGRPFEALSRHELAIAADHKYALARFGRAQALQQIGRIDEAVLEYERFLALEPRHHEARSYRLFALHYQPDVPREKLFAEHVAFGRLLDPAPRVAFTNPSNPTRRLRIAMLSPDLREHACAYFIEPLLRHLDREQFEIYLYHDHFREDAVSARLKSHAEVWRNFVGQPAALVEKTIRADSPDILIDLAGHTGLNRLPLFARRLAPVQATYLGYPDTTGVPAMDYRFTDAVADPEGIADKFATEQLVRLAGSAWTYAPSADAPEVAPAPCLKHEHVTFGCFNNLAKVTDPMLALWGKILRDLPSSRLRIKGKGFGDATVRQKYEERFARLGLPIDRVDLLEHTAEAKDHLALYGDVDIALDTFPYHGTTTTCEALWMGVPVVTLVGEAHMSRVGASLLGSVGHSEWAANGEAEYVEIAVSLAKDRGAIAVTRAGLRKRMRQSDLLDHGTQAYRFGQALRECWSEWCAKRVPEALVA